MSEFAVIINYQNPGEQLKTIVLDTVDSVSITGSSTITSQPMVNGDEISEHIFKQGSTMRISGACSMQGSQGIVLDGTKLGLADFEKVFEELKNSGSLCTIYKVATKNIQDIRFQQRFNMVLQSVSWSEDINSLDFTLNFKEVLLTKVVELQADVDDKYLPNIEQPPTLSFTDTLIDWSQIDAKVMDILTKESLVTTEFINKLRGLGESALIGLVPAILAGAVAWLCIALGTNPVGWIVGAAIGVVIFFVSLVNKFADAIRRRRYAIEMFKYYENNDEKNKEEVNRFVTLINDIHESFEKLNDLIKVYQVSEDNPQEAVISVGDDYYIFTFTRNNVEENYSLYIENTDQSKTKDFGNIESALESFDQATRDNMLIKTKDNYRLYIFNPSDNKKDLRNYFIVSCAIDPSEFNDLITKAIETHIYKDANK